MNKRVVALGLVAIFAVGAVTAVVLAVTGGDGDGDAVAGPSTTTTTLAELTDTAQELVDRLADARAKALHLVFTGDLAAIPETGKVTVEIWWDGDKARQNILTETAQERREQASLVLPGGSVFCEKPEDSDWECRRMASTSTDGGSAGIIGSLVAGLSGKTVTSAKAQVAGEEADCYTLDQQTGDVVCLRRDDVPVKFTLGGSELVVKSADTDVAGSVFEPPAEPDDATSPTTGGAPTTGG